MLVSFFIVVELEFIQITSLLITHMIFHHGIDLVPECSDIWVRGICSPERISFIIANLAASVGKVVRTCSALQEASPVPLQRTKFRFVDRYICHLVVIVDQLVDVRRS